MLTRTGLITLSLKWIDILKFSYMECYQNQEV